MKKYILIILIALINISCTTSQQRPNQEYTLQILYPTGGKILRPTGWFYAEAHREPVYDWIISKENIHDGPYTTGMRIQVFSGVRDNTGKSAKQFIEDFILQKKNEKVDVLNEFYDKDMGLFSNKCIETIEGPHRILYSLYWGNDDLDIAIVSIQGTTTELWDKYSSTFAQMGMYEIIDMNLFEGGKYYGVWPYKETD